ncbi:Glycosyltransferase involved in cell wall bisynthesis [Mesobacillus persicus]|uniref:Glycosyltransferase involved in cell wall bisynthesis n=1 Tax=Mesobacillus persicus TaxID=930146 RepID=A0A1H8G526_9BACI|nr:glycosyltransferase family 2 protein [Mesobacillus persicus]SEN39102.1 Glycosyltransferase involved in cell wall bisynthesis [Mesobacillus persicus]
MDNQPLISIVITTYNRLPLLAELVESLSRQTFRDFEVIIVNDCGENVDVVKTLYPELDINIIEMERNSKHVYARNKGVQHAKGEWIMLMDDDDLLVPTHIQRMVQESDEVDLLYSDVEIVQFKIKDHVRVAESRVLFAYELDLEAMKKFSTFVPSGCLYRRVLHDAIGFFDPYVHNYWDWDFFLRVSAQYRVKRVAAAGVLYDFSEFNDNQSKMLKSREFYLKRLCEKHDLGELPSKNFFLLLEEAEVRKRKAESEILWDGKSFNSRLMDG